MMARFAVLVTMWLLQQSAALRAQPAAVIARPGRSTWHDVCADDQVGYTKHCKRSCKARTMSVTLRGAENATAACAKACSSSAKCECFELSASGRICRIGMSKGKSVRPGRGNAYTTLMDDSILPALAEAVADLPPTCRRSQKVGMMDSCSEYFACKADGTWGIATCPEGLAYNAQNGRCDWPTVVPGCESLAAEHKLPMVGCGTDEFVLAASRAPVVQDWLSSELDALFNAVVDDPTVSDRPEGKAALHILHTVKIQMVSSKNESSLSRYATFSKEADGSLVMQAIALVEQTGNEVNVMAILSRRSLLNDQASRSGGGKALLRGILDTVHAEIPGHGLTLIGTPGDKFVEALYRAHGMQQYGVEETGMPKLKLEIPERCVSFMTEKILCKNTGARDYAAIGWRLLPGSFYLYRTCAHMMPAGTYLKEMGKAFGIRF